MPSATSREPPPCPRLGPDERPVIRQQREKSIGSDETFAYDVDDPVVIHRELLRLADRTAARVRAAGMMGRTVSIKVRFADFTTITRARTLRDPTDVSRDIYATARSLFDALGLQRARIRLVGVRMEGLVEAEGAPVQVLSTSPTTAGGTPTGRSTRPAPGSVPGPCAPLHGP